MKMSIFQKSKISDQKSFNSKTFKKISLKGSLKRKISLMIFMELRVKLRNLKESLPKEKPQDSCHQFTFTPLSI